MNFQENIEPFNEQPDFMINLCQAAQVLGYKDYRKIESSSMQVTLKLTKCLTRRKKVRYHEVMGLAKAILNYRLLIDF